MDPFDYLQIVPNFKNRFLKSTKSQNFPFHNPLIHYLLKDANAKTFYKLHCSCKFFILQEKIGLCQKIKILSEPFTGYSDDEEIIDFVLANSFLELPFKIIIYGTFECFVNDNRKFSSTVILQKFYRFEAESIEIENQDITVSDFKNLLTKNTKIMLFKNCKIFNFNGSSILKEKEILKLVENFNKLSRFHFFNFSLNIRIYKRRCSHCGSIKSPGWLPHEMTNQWVCLSCGSYFARHKIDRDVSFTTVTWT